MNYRFLSILLLPSFVLGCTKSVDAPMKETSVSLANNLIMNYWDHYERGCTEPYMVMKLEQFYPVPLHYEFEPKSGVNRREILLSNYESMNESIKYESYEDSIDIENLNANTDYYIRVYEYKGSKLVNKTSVEKYTTMDYPRTILVPMVSNTRDIGSLPTTDGHRLAQGKIYRGAELDYIDAEGCEILTDKLGIKTDFDMRKSGEGTCGTGSPVYGLNYINIPGVMYVSGSGGMRPSSNNAIIRQEIQVFANPDNYPIYCHCVAGRDRTGTIVAILLALLGVDTETILKEYELTFFSSKGYSADSTVLEMVAQANEVIDFVIEKGKQSEGDTLQQCAENYLRDIVGVSQEEINVIKNMMTI